MAKVQLTTNLHFDVRDALDRYVASSGVPINRVVEDGIKWRINGQGGLPADLEKELEAWCQQTGMKRGDVVELAVRRFLEQESEVADKPGAEN